MLSPPDTPEPSSPGSRSPASPSSLRRRSTSRGVRRRASITWGPTDATKAGKDTIRGKFGTSIERNATHGSDAEATAAFEVGYFFAGLETA
jgi:hypothetical protein